MQIEQKVVDIIKEVLSIENIEEELYDEDLKELGLDSLSFIRIIVLLEEQFECEIPETKILLTELNTVNKIIETIKILCNNE